jgi:hypothetical protein
MSTTLVQAAADGAHVFSTDPVIRGCVVKLSRLVQDWFSTRGHDLGEVSLHSGLAKQFVFVEVRTPSGLPVRVACEFQARAKGEVLQAWLHVRATAGNGWVPKDSATVELRYGDHPGVYKMELLSKQLLEFLGMHENSPQPQGTLVSTMLQELMDEVETSALA